MIHESTCLHLVCVCVCMCDSFEALVVDEHRAALKDPTKEEEKAVVALQAAVRGNFQRARTKTSALDVKKPNASDKLAKAATAREDASTAKAKAVSDKEDKAAAKAAKSPSFKMPSALDVGAAAEEEEEEEEEEDNMYRDEEQRVDAEKGRPRSMWEEKDLVAAAMANVERLVKEATGVLRRGRDDEGRDDEGGAKDVALRMYSEAVSELRKVQGAAPHLFFAGSEIMGLVEELLNQALAIKRMDIGAFLDAFATTSKEARGHTDAAQGAKDQDAAEKELTAQAAKSAAARAEQEMQAASARSKAARSAADKHEKELEAAAAKNKAEREQKQAEAALAVEAAQTKADREAVEAEADASQRFRVGQRVMARFKKGENWFAGTVANGPDTNGNFDVKYDDGDFEEEVIESSLRAFTEADAEAAAAAAVKKMPALTG